MMATLFDPRRDLLEQLEPLAAGLNQERGRDHRPSRIRASVQRSDDADHVPRSAIRRTKVERPSVGAISLLLPRGPFL